MAITQLQKLNEKIRIPAGRRCRIVCGPPGGRYTTPGVIEFEDGVGWWVILKDRKVEKRIFLERDPNLKFIQVDGMPFIWLEDGEFLSRFIGPNRSTQIPEKSPATINDIIKRRMAKGLSKTLTEPKLSIMGIPIKWVFIGLGIILIGGFFILKKTGVL